MVRPNRGDLIGILVMLTGMAVSLNIFHNVNATLVWFVGGSILTGFLHGRFESGGK